MHKQSEIAVYSTVVAAELEIDTEGRVWRLKKRTADRWTGGTKTSACKRVRAEILTPAGYLQVRSMIDGTRHYASAARLVWLHTHGPIPLGLTVNHKDGVKHNNHPDNLGLATYSEQRVHAIKVLGARHHDVRGSKHPKTHLTEEEVIAMRAARSAGEMVKVLASRYRTSNKAASAICRGKTWRHCLPG